MSFMSKAFIIMNLVLYMSVIVLLLVVPEFIKFIGVVFFISLFLSLGIFVKYRVQIITFLKTKLFRDLFSNLLTLILVFGILGIVNYLGVKNDVFFDLTKQRLHSLSEQSVNAIKLLGNNQITMKLFAQRNNWPRFLNLLSLYQKESKKIELNFYDVNKDLALANLYNIKQEGTLVIEYQGKRFKVVADNELAVTNLLLKILSPSKKIIYYSVGHNEMSLQDKNNIGADFLREKILNSNFMLKPVELQEGIPSDAASVLILNPQIEFLESEIINLKKYLLKGGNLLTTLAPRFNGVIIKKYIEMLKNFGVVFHNVLILDRLASQQGAQASIPVINVYDPQHPITKNMTDRTLFPVSGAFETINNSLMKWTTLGKSTPFPGSWGEINFEEVKTGRAQYTENLDSKGPLKIIVAGESHLSRIVAFSSASFISNQFQGQSNNFNFFLNALSWLSRDDSLMSLDRPELAGNLVYISAMQVNVILYFGICIFPFIFFGMAVWVYRRKISG